VERKNSEEKEIVKPLPYPKIHSRKQRRNNSLGFWIFSRSLRLPFPFSEALQQMPPYARFMKELLTKKRKYIEEETIEVQGNCSAII